MPQPQAIWSGLTPTVKQQGIDDMDRDVDQPIAARIQAAQRVIDGERQADERPSSKR